MLENIIFALTDIYMEAADGYRTKAAKNIVSLHWKFGPQYARDAFVRYALEGATVVSF